MKTLLLMLLIVTGCSTTRYYQAAEVRQELKKNAQKLETMEALVERDYQDKKAYLQFFIQNKRQSNNFVLDDLNYRINDLRLKRNSILTKSKAVKQKNNLLIRQLKTKNKIKDSDEVFEKIETFADSTTKEADVLFQEVLNYKNASEDFVRFAFITR